MLDEVSINVYHSIMANGVVKITDQKTSLPVALDALAESIWRLPRRKRESLEEMLEKKFVATTLRRAKEIPRLRKKGKLLTLEELKRGLSRR